MAGLVSKRQKLSIVYEGEKMMGELRYEAKRQPSNH